MVDGFDCFPESAPNIIILPCLFDNFQTLQDVNDVVDASALDTELDGDLIELQNQAVMTLEILNELFAKLFQALFLPVVGQDLLFYLLLVKKLLQADAGSAFGYLKQRSAHLQQPPYHQCLLILKETVLLRQKRLA